MGVQSVACRSRGQGDQQGRVYRAGLAVQKARMSSTDGCTVHSLAFDRPGAQAGQERSGRATGGQVRAHVGCAKPNLELRRPSWSPWRAVRRSNWSPRRSKRCSRRSKRRPRGSKLGSKDVQEEPKTPQDHPSRLQEASRGSKGRPRGSKLAPRGTQESPS